MLCVLAKSWSSVRSITWLFMSQIPFALFAFYYNTHVLLFSEKKEKKERNYLQQPVVPFSLLKMCTYEYICVHIHLWYQFQNLSIHKIFWNLEIWPLTLSVEVTEIWNILRFLVHRNFAETIGLYRTRYVSFFFFLA